MLRINEIHAVENEKKKIRKAIYKEIYATFSRKVKHSVEMGHKFVLLTIPQFVYGQPTFDRGKAYTYIKKQFENGGFSIANAGEYTMYLSWSKEEKKAVEAAKLDDTPFVSLINLKKAANKYK
jgi:hypothetical protein